mmetsp:Transcript_70676/g.111893  ORF Transcript_70676/g.111893 Transcript_70676/m.111893 type:complete len:244 (-) Transcript_70676:208-939(-)
MPCRSSKEAMGGNASSTCSGISTLISCPSLFSSILATSSALKSSGASKKTFWKGAKAFVEATLPRSVFFLTQALGAGPAWACPVFDQPESKWRPASLACRKAATAPDLVRPVSAPAMAATGVVRVWTGARRMAAVAAGLPGAVLFAVAARSLSAAAAREARSPPFPPLPCGHGAPRPLGALRGALALGCISAASSAMALVSASSGSGSASSMSTASRDPQFSPGHSSSKLKVIQLPTASPAGA